MRKRIEPKLVRDVMTVRPKTVRADMRLQELKHLFEAHEFNAFPVVDDGYVLRGIVTKQLEPFGAKWESFGWEVREIDGHDYAALLVAFEPSTTGKPVAVIANTIKGKGVSFIEDRVEWHHKVPDADQVRAALEELSR